MTARIVGNLFGDQPRIYFAKKQVACPLYAADFDPLNPHFLLVGGGGGSSSTGVPNRITLIDTSSTAELKEISDIDLAPDEDSVTSLAIADSSPSTLLAYAGINSSVKDQAAGKNEHFRSFRVPVPAKRRKDDTESVPANATVVKTQALARTAIFRNTAGPKNECYQRVLRLSPPLVDDVSSTEKPGPRKLKKRVATIASALAKQNEVITFPAEESPSATTKMLSRTNLEQAEANDVDLIIAEDEKSTFVLAYCTDANLYLQQLGDQKRSVNSEPLKVYETQSGPQGRSKIRAIRFLSPRYILLLQNRVSRSGAELILLKISKDYTETQQVLIKYLKSIKQAVGLDTCVLTKDDAGSQQFIVAIAGQDSSLQIHTLDYVAGKGMTGFTSYADCVDMHSGPITKIVFSNFIGPTLPVSKTTPPQYVRLATVGVDKNVSVMTLSLLPYPTTGSQRSRPRYVLKAPSGSGQILKWLLTSFIWFFLVSSILITFLELRGAIPQVLGTSKYLPRRWQEQYGAVYPYGHDNPGPVIPQSMPEVNQMIDKIKLSEATPIIEKLESLSDSIRLADATAAIEKLEEMQSSVPSLEDVKDTVAHLVSQKESDDAHADKAVIIRDLEHLGGEVSAELRHEAEVVKEGTLKKWENLSPKEQKKWKEKMKEAGKWAEHQGEAVLKGVFFGQLAGIVGGFVRGG